MDIKIFHFGRKKKMNKEKVKREMEGGTGGKEGGKGGWRSG